MTRWRRTPPRLWWRSRSRCRTSRSGRQSTGDHHRIFVDELSPLCGVRSERFSDVAIEIYRYWQGAFRVPRIPPRHQGGRGLDLARCIGKGDSEKYLGAVEILFKLQDRLMAQTKDTLFYVGKLHGMSVRKSRPARRIRRVRQAQRRSAIAAQVIEGHLDADLLPQRRRSRDRCRSRNWKNGSSRC